MKRLLMIAAVVVVGLLVAIGLWIWKQRRELSGPVRGSGVVEGTETDVAARLGARIVAVPVQEGTRIRAGELLLRLDCDDSVAALEEASAQLLSAQADSAAAQARVEAAERRTGAVRTQRRAASAQEAALREQRETATRDAERLARVGRYATEAARDRSRSQAERLAREEEAAGASTRATAMQADAASADVRAARAAADAAHAKVESLSAAVERARLLVEECEVRAETDAWVDEIFYEVGEIAPAGAALVRLVELEEVEITFYVPNAELGAAKVGARARVEADAWPNRTFEGRVMTVGARAEFTPRNVQTRTDRDRLVYPVKVRVPNPEMRLRPGMPVEVILPGTEPT